MHPITDTFNHWIEQAKFFGELMLLGVSVLTAHVVLIVFVGMIPIVVGALLSFCLVIGEAIVSERLHWATRIALCGVSLVWLASLAAIPGATGFYAVSSLATFVGLYAFGIVLGAIVGFLALRRAETSLQPLAPPSAA